MPELPGVDALIEWTVGKLLLRGYVATFRDTESGRVLTVRLPEGNFATVLATKVRAVEGEDTVDVVATASLADADRIARAILAGLPLRFPINQQLKILALATLGKESPR